jgi:glycosyltransferase involved in cell wall biosynthesis
VRPLFATWHGFAGCIGSCRHAAAVLGGDWATVEPDEPPAAVLEAEHLLLSSWRPEYEAILALRTRPTIVRWHSSLLQTELSGEIEMLVDLVERADRGELAAVAASDPALVALLARPTVRHLPEVLDLAAYVGVRPAALEGTNVSLFGEAHGRKNLLVQAAAFERVRAGAPGWTLHLNGQTLRREWYGRWLRLARIPFVDHGFLPHAEYLSLVAAMDAGLAASLSESFGILPLEHILLGVPAVTSPAVVSVDDQAFAAADPSDVGSIADALGRALAGRAALEPVQAAVIRQVEERVRLARSALASLVG